MNLLEHYLVELLLVDPVDSHVARDEVGVRVLRVREALAVHLELSSLRGDHHGRLLIVGDDLTLARYLDQANLVEDVLTVEMVLVEHYLEILAVGVKVDCLQLSGLVVCLDVIVEREVAEPLKGDVGVVLREEVGTRAEDLRSVGVELDARWDLALMHKELDLLQLNERGELDHDLLRVNTEPLALPANQGCLVLA